MSISPSAENSPIISSVSRNSVRQIGIRQRSLRRHCRLGRATELVFILVTGATLTLSDRAEAQTWNGASDTNWAVGTNWTPNGVPVAGDTVSINNGALGNQPSVIDARSAAQVNVSAGTLTITGTVKAHTEWNGIKQTVLTRPKKLDPAPDPAAGGAQPPLLDAAPRLWEAVASPHLNGAAALRDSIVRTPARSVSLAH